MNAIAQVSASPVSGPKLDNRRVAAAILDLVIVSVGAVAILVAGDSLSGERQSALSAVILGWALYYFFALESGDGQTVGKKLLKLRVVRTDGRPAGMREVAVRTVLRVVDNYLVGLIVMLATGDRRQRIGDLAAGTIVVDASGPALASPAPAAVAEPEEEAADDDEGDEDVDASADDEPVATQTITLPGRAGRPTTLADLTEPEDEAEPGAEQVGVEEPVMEDEPVADEVPVEDPMAEPVEDAEEPVAEESVEEPVAEEPVVEIEPVAEEPVVEIEPVAEEPVVEIDPEPVAEEPVIQVEPVPVAPVAEEPVVEIQPAVEGEAEELPSVSSPTLEELAQDVAAVHAEPEGEDMPEDDEPVNVKSVETVSAIDLVMGGAEESAADAGSDSARDDEGPASA